METKIYIGDVYGNIRDDRQGVIVEIENRGIVFKWLPTYDEVYKILGLLERVEHLNQDKHK